jgi:hypothetical protein
MKEKLIRISPTQVREARTDLRRVAAREDGGAIAGFGKLTGALCSRDSRHHSSKEKHGEVEKRMVSSPICLPRRFRRPTMSPSNGGVATCGGSARAKP